MPMQSQNFADLLDPVFRKIFFDAVGLKEYPAIVTKLFHEQTSTKGTEKDSGVVGFGYVPTVNENASITYDTPVQAFDYTYTHKVHALGYKISRILWDDDQHMTMRKYPQALGRSMRTTMEFDGANIFNRAETAAYTYATGKTLLASDHPNASSGTQSNKLTTAADLSATSWKQAKIDIANITTSEGLPAMLTPKYLVLPTELDWDSQILFNSTLDPDSANNAINPASNDGIERVIWKGYLTDPDAWFIVMDDHQFNWIWRDRITHQNTNDFDTDAAKFKIRARWSLGCSDNPIYSVFGSMGG